MIEFDIWWNSAAADSFRAQHEDMGGEQFRPVWDAAVRAAQSPAPAHSPERELLTTFTDWARQVAAREDVPRGIRSAAAGLHDDGKRMLAKAAPLAPAVGADELNLDDFLRLSEEVWPAEAPRTGERAWWPAQLKTNLCPRAADLTHFGVLVEREVRRRMAAESDVPVQHQGEKA